MNNKQCSLLFIVALAATIITAGCGPAPYSMTVYAEFGNPSASGSGFNSHMVFNGKLNTTKIDSAVNNTAKHEPRADTHDSAANTIGKTPQFRQFDDTAKGGGGGGGTLCAGAGICSASPSQSADANAVPVNFLYNPGRDSFHISLSFSLAALDSLQPREQQLIQASTTTYTFDASYTFSDPMYQQLNIPPTAQIPGGQPGTVVVNGDLVVMTMPVVTNTGNAAANPTTPATTAPAIPDTTTNPATTATTTPTATGADGH